MMNETKMKLDLPDVNDGRKAIITDDRIVFVRLSEDDWDGNPLEDIDSTGMIYSFNSRHTNSIGRERLEELRAEYGDDLVALSYFEHGRCRWGVAGTMSGTPDFQWDGVAFAGVWHPDKYLLDWANSETWDAAKRLEMMETWAKQACDLYTSYCNGTDNYCYEVEAYKLMRVQSGRVVTSYSEYRQHETPIYDDSCGGFNCEDMDDFKAEVAPAVRHALEMELPA